MKNLITQVHPSVILGKKVKLGREVRIGPFSVIEDGACLGDGTVIMNSVYIGKGVRIGKNNVIHTGTSIGHEAQNKASKGVKSFVNIGDHNVFREYVTVNSGSLENSITRVGDHNYFMANAHVAHDCLIHDYVTVANAVLLGGFVVLEDYCVLGGNSGVHQFCRIGSYAMLGGHGVITKDLPPYMLVDHNEVLVGSLNMVGLRRAGFSEEMKRDIKRAYKLLYLSGLNTSHAVEEIIKSCDAKNISPLVEFIKASKRGILAHR